MNKAGDVSLVFGKALLEIGREDKNIVVLDADVPHSTRTYMFKEEFPERFYDVGVAEQNMMGVAAGLALTGKIPFVNTFSVFAVARVFDQIRQSIAYPHLNVKICGAGAGISLGDAGPSHHSLEDIALIRSLPGMTIVIPADRAETKKAVKAITRYKGPVFLRLSRGIKPDIHDENYEFRIGKAVTLREGEDVTIIGTGTMVAKALEAAEQLSLKGIDAEVVNLHTIKPLDEGAIMKSAKKTGCVVTVEEHSIIGGLGSAVAEVLVENGNVPMQRVGIRDIFLESAYTEDLMKYYGLSVEDIAKSVKRCLEKKSLIENKS